MQLAENQIMEKTCYYIDCNKLSYLKNNFAIIVPTFRLLGGIE